MPQYQGIVYLDVLRYRNDHREPEHILHLHIPHEFIINIHPLDVKVLHEIHRRARDFAKDARALFRDKNSDAVLPVQEKLNAVWDLIFDLPFYRSLPLNIYGARNLFPALLQDKSVWKELMKNGSERNKAFMVFIDKLEYFA